VLVLVPASTAFANTGFHRVQIASERARRYRTWAKDSFPADSEAAPGGRIRVCLLSNSATYTSVRHSATRLRTIVYETTLESSIAVLQTHLKRP
jgi:hypothetical protein